MSKKSIIMIFTTIGMAAGGAVPLLWGGSAFGGWSIFLGMIGGFVGIWVGAKIGKALLG